MCLAPSCSIWRPICCANAFLPNRLPASCVPWNSPNSKMPSYRFGNQRGTNRSSHPGLSLGLQGWERERDRRITRSMGDHNPFVTGECSWTLGYRPVGEGLSAGRSVGAPKSLSSLGQPLSLSPLLLGQSSETATARFITCPLAASADRPGNDAAVMPAGERKKMATDKSTMESETQRIAAAVDLVAFARSLGYETNISKTREKLMAADIKAGGAIMERSGYEINHSG